MEDFTSDVEDPGGVYLGHRKKRVLGDDYIFRSFVHAKIEVPGLEKGSGFRGTRVPGCFGSEFRVPGAALRLRSLSSSKCRSVPGWEESSGLFWFRVSGCFSSGFRVNQTLGLCKLNF